MGRLRGFYNGNKSNNPKRPRGRYGVIPNNSDRARVRLSVREGAVLSPPASVDWFSSVPEASWGMLANGPDPTAGQGSNYAGCGDCTVAGVGHMIDQVAWYAQGQKPAPVSSIQALTAYEAVSGYNPRTGANDNGAELQQVLQYWTKTPIASYTPSGYAQIDITNVALVQTCIDLFGAVYSGFSVPAIFETQFDNGEPWDVPTGRSGSQIEGGHAVPLVGYDQNYITCVTWGATQKITYAAFAKYWGNAEGGEGWVAVLPQSVEATGSTFEGLNTAAANAQFQSLTGSTESPFPTVTPVNPPTPPTPPPPVVGPDTDAADVALYDAVVAAIASGKALEAAFVAWEGDHGFPAAAPLPPHHHGH